MAKKTYELTISRRGVYYDLDKSPYSLEFYHKTYKFSSRKKREVYLKRLKANFETLEKLNGKIYRLTDTGLKDFDLESFKRIIIDKTYDNMLYK